MQEKDDINEIDVNVEHFDDEDLDRESILKEMDLAEGVLVTNLFVPCMVFCSKIDLIEHGDKDTKQILEKNLDFIQVTLRKYCLAYGSSLVFGSSNSNSNIQLIYEYFLSRLYDIDFPYPSNTLDKEALFIPTGLDTFELINQSADIPSFLNSLMNREEISEDPLFHEVVKKPQRTLNLGLKEEEKKEILVADWKS